MISKILLFLCCLLCLLRFSVGDPYVNPIGYFCDNTTYNPKSTSGSIYRSNLNFLLSALSSNASRTTTNGFYNTTAGTASDHSNTVYGLFLCRGDLSSDACQRCVANASSEILKECPDQTDAIYYYGECLLRYSNQSIFSRDDETFPFDWCNPVNAAEPEKFIEELGKSLAEIKERAAYDSSGKKFAVKEADYSPFRRIYALGQCTPDISPVDCEYCLQNAISRIPEGCGSHRGGRFLFPSCSIRYEIFPFYNLVTAPVPALNRPPPLPLPPTPPPLSIPTRSKEDGRISTRTIIAIIVPILAAIMVFAVILCVSRRSTKRYNAITGKTGVTGISVIESLQYNLSAIQVATTNFAVSNRIGEGGFGPVYKGTLPNGQQIAVKRLSRSSAQGFEEFKNEIALVARHQHRNLVRLLGFCFEREENILIYEFVPNKSLDCFLFG